MKEVKKMNNKRNYNYLCVIYEDDSKFKTQFDALLELKDVIYIKHDQDVSDDGEPKKPHYHFVIKLKTACTISALSKKIDVAENMIEPIKKSFNGSLKYLIHFKDDNKYNYDADDVKSNSEKLLKRFKELVQDEIPGGDHVMSIQDYIDIQTDYVKMRDLGRYANSIGVWNYFMRYYAYIRDIVNEHNAEISCKRYHIDDDFYSN